MLTAKQWQNRSHLVLLKGQPCQTQIYHLFTVCQLWDGSTSFRRSWPRCPLGRSANDEATHATKWLSTTATATNRRRVGTEVTTELVLAVVTSRLDYCNSVCNLQSTAEPLQRVQNTAARLIFNLGRCQHVSPCFIQLHCLPIRHRIIYKLCTLLHKFHIGKSPGYLADYASEWSTA